MPVLRCRDGEIHRQMFAEGLPVLFFTPRAAMDGGLDRDFQVAGRDASFGTP